MLINQSIKKVKIGIFSMVQGFGNFYLSKKVFANFANSSCNFAVPQGLSWDSHPRNYTTTQSPITRNLSFTCKKIHLINYSTLPLGTLQSQIKLTMDP